MEAIDIFKNFIKTDIKVFSSNIQEKLCDSIERRKFLSTLSDEERAKYQDNALRANLVNGVLNVIRHKSMFNVFVPADLQDVFERLWTKLAAYQHFPINEKIEYVRKVKDLSFKLVQANS